MIPTENPPILVMRKEIVFGRGAKASIKLVSVLAKHEGMPLGRVPPAEGCHCEVLYQLVHDQNSILFLPHLPHGSVKPRRSRCVCGSSTYLGEKHEHRVAHCSMLKPADPLFGVLEFCEVYHAPKDVTHELLSTIVPTTIPTSFATIFPTTAPTIA